MIPNTGQVYWWIFCACSVVVLFITIKISMLIGRKYFSHLENSVKAQTGTSSNAMLGLTGFLLAISFSVAEQKFSLRKEMVLKEANAVGTAFLRSKFLKPKYSQEAGELLKKYSNVRYEAVNNKEYLKGKIISEKFSKRLWEIAVLASKEEPNSLPVRLFSESINNLIDLFEERWTVGIYLKVPPAIIILLFFSTLTSIAFLSLSFGAKGNKNPFIPLGPGLLFLAIALMITDLGNSEQAFFKINQAPIHDTIKMMDDWK